MFSLKVFTVLRLGQVVNVNMKFTSISVVWLFSLGHTHLQLPCLPHPKQYSNVSYRCHGFQIGFQFLCHANFLIFQCFVSPHWRNLSQRFYSNFCVAISKILLKYWTTCKHKQTENTLMEYMTLCVLISAKTS